MPCELPLERFGYLLVSLLKLEYSVGCRLQRAEVVWSEYLPLNDREIYLDLVKPTRMDRQVHGHDVRPRLPQASDAALTPVRRTIVDDPEHPFCTAIRLLAHNLFHEPVERFDTGGGLATPKDLGTPYIQCCKAGQCSLTLIFVPIDRDGFSRTGRYDSVLTTSGLDAGFLVGRDHVLIGSQQPTLPDTLIQVQNKLRFLLKIGVTSTLVQNRFFVR